MFCAWLAWFRFRVVIPVWGRTLPTVISYIDSTLRAIGGAPTCLLTDNEKTMTIAGSPGSRSVILKSWPQDATTACKCTPASRSIPSPHGGGEATVRIAKTDLIPTSANLWGSSSFAELRRACAIF